MSTKTITPEIEAAQAAVDQFGNEVFPGFHSITEDYEYSLYTNISREFDVAELMTGLGIEVAPEYQFRPSPFVAASTRDDYEAAYAMTAAPEFYEKLDDLAHWPEVVAEFGSEAAERAMCILQDSSAMSELLVDYFNIEAVSWTDAAAKLTEYMKLLDAADTTYRQAGWEL